MYILLIRLRSIQIIMFVFLLCNRLRLVRKNLQQILESQHFYSGNLNDCALLRSTERIFVLDFSSINCRLLYDRLFNLKQVYGELYEICELINLTYGSSCLVIVTQNFLDFTINCYWIFLEFLKLEKSEPDFSRIIDFVILQIPIMVLIGTLIFYCSLCSRYVSALRIIFRL